MQKKIIIAVSVILAVAVIAVCTVIPSLYVNGLLGDVHKYNKPKSGQIRVACVGDSLTYGLGVSGWAKNNYPAQLGRMLGDRYCVNNYGYSGRTATKSGDRPYVNEKVYRQSLDFAPNIIVIMLGSNDTKAINWKGKDEYVREYTEIINSYLALDSVREVYIMSPTPVFMHKGEEPYGISIEIVATVLRDTAKELAGELGLKHIDLYAVFEDRGDLFSDGAHPNAEGARIIAEVVSNQIAGGYYNPPPAD